MSSTRLLVLGTVRIFQPVHGYFVRRELLSWHAEQWAHLNPGSVYNALRTLAREGFIEEAGTEAEGRRPARTSYRLTADGETEFNSLLRQAAWNISPFSPDELMAFWSFSWALRREEVIAAFEHRLEAIAASERLTEYSTADIARGNGTPAHVAEHWRMTQARLDGEARWLTATVERLRAGEYWFTGEPDSPFKSLA